MRASKIISLIVGGVLLTGCGTLKSLNPFGGNSTKKEEARAERYDDAPLIRSTGAIPPDHENARHTDEDLGGKE